jgi:hypothetical protein
MQPRTPLLILILILLVCAFITVANFFTARATTSTNSATLYASALDHSSTWRESNWIPAPQDFPTPPTKITSALATIPADAAGIPTQTNLDLYSWLTFIALNWPAATTTCTANTNLSILNGQGPVVWETYLTDSDVFVTPPAKPSQWCPQSTSASRSPALAKLSSPLRLLVQRRAVRKILVRQSKASASLSTNFPGIDQAVGGVLTDQNGRFVRYEITMNPDEYGFLTDPNNNLWSAAGQNSYTSTITFPDGPSNYGSVGAIEIKAAWKVLSQKEINSKRFYMTTAIVFNDDSQSPSPGKNPVTLGLVGLHIIHKTKRQPDWTWSTFEHVDNLKPPPGSPFGAKGSFFNPGCSPLICPPNVQTAATPYTELKSNGVPNNKPVQVVRLNPVGDDVESLNKTFQTLLKGSVWANYKLISTQWIGEDGTLPKPPFLANMTLETFIQAPKPPSDGPIPYPSPGYNPFAAGVTSSCMKCHSVATTASGKAKADFSFLLGEAH